MTRHRSSLWGPVLLLLVCTALAWVIYRQVAVAPSLKAAANGSNVAATTVPELPPELQYSMRPVEDFQVILERPIFSPSRRPPPVESVESPPPDSDVTFTLKGILVDDDVRIALFRSKRNKKAVRLRQGDELEGWTLVQIEADHVTLARGGIEKVLEPTYDPSGQKKRPPKKQSPQSETQPQQGQE